MKVSAQELSKLISRQDDTNPPTAEELAALVDQTLPPDRREAVLNHLERSPDSARAVAIALEPGATSGGAGFRWLAVAASAVAAVALASVVWLGGTPEEDTLRAADPSISPAPGAVISTPDDLFSWPAPPDLSPRRVRIMSAAAETIWLSEPTSPPVDLPAGTVASGKTYLWQLEDVDGTVVAGPNWFRMP